MAMLGCGDGSSTYLGPGDAKRLVNETDGTGIHTDRSTGQADAPSVQTKAIKPAKVTETISIPRKKVKPPDLPIETARGHPDKLNGCGNLVDTSSICKDGHSDGDETETAVNETDIVRTRQISQRTRNLPYTPENGTPKRSTRWRKVSIDDGEVYIPLDALIEPASRTFAFGQLESGVETIVPNVEGKRAGDGDGDRNGGDGDVGDTASGSSIHSKRVEAVLLAGKSQYMCQDRRRRNGDSPVSSVPPVHPAECPYRDVRHQRGHRRI